MGPWGISLPFIKLRDENLVPIKKRVTLKQEASIRNTHSLIGLYPVG